MLLSSSCWIPSRIWKFVGPQVSKRMSYSSSWMSSVSAQSPTNNIDDVGTPTLKNTNNNHHRRRRHWLPRRIILMRHGESIGNVDETAYATIPDWKIELTQLGKEQATQAGREIQDLCRGGSLYAYVSPYKRTMQTWQQIKQELEEHNDGRDEEEKLSSSSSSVSIIGVRQEPRIAEQQFGNYQNPYNIEIAKEERQRFGRFFFRFPNGEAGLDVYNRATSFLATMTRDVHQHRELHYDMTNFNVLIVTHGLCLRLIIMRYFQLTVEEFEESYNADNAKLYIMNRTTLSTSSSFSSDNDDASQNDLHDTEQREFFRLDDESRDALNLKGDVSNEKPTFQRDGYDL